jgi:RNA polymerase sigma-70 factor, ECF subfamily
MEDDLHAIRRLKRGDIDGLEALVLRYQVKAVRSAFLVLRDEETARDITQQTFLKIYHHIQKYDERKPFAPYFYKSVLNAALDESRKSTKFSILTEDISEVEELIQKASTLENEIERIELKGMINQALERLNPRQRAAVIMRYYLEMSEQEMAEVLRTPPGTVKWLLHEARSRLRGLLGNERSEL